MQVSKGTIVQFSDKYIEEFESICDSNRRTYKINYRPWRGKVIRVDADGIADIQWNMQSEPGIAHVRNLTVSKHKRLPTCLR
jgi:hypothetical protein